MHPPSGAPPTYKLHECSSLSCICTLHMRAYNQSLGFCRTFTSFSSSDPGSGTTLYFQAISGGADTMIDSTRPPSSPNFTPRSYSKLNSRYRPRLQSGQHQQHCISDAHIKRLLRMVHSYQLKRQWYDGDLVITLLQESVCGDASLW